MRETKKGRGYLHDVPDRPSVTFEVDYEIHFDSELRTVHPGLPPVLKRSVIVSFIRSVEGRTIPEGVYFLVEKDEIHRLKNLGFSWHLLAMP